MTLTVDSVDDVRQAREQFVSRAVTAPPLVVVGAEGARIEADDGRSYLDFAGGIGCQNLGHGPGDVVRAIHEQVDRYLHQCFMVGMYEPYVDVCRRLAELYPGPGTAYKSVLLNSGAEAVENAVKIARAATGRPAVIAFDRAFHGRTLLTMSLTSKVVPTSAASARSRLRSTAPRRRSSRAGQLRRRDRRAGDAVQGRGRSRERRLRRARAGPGRGRLRADAARLPAAAAGAVRGARDPLRRRRGAGRRRPHRADVGDRALRRRRPTSSSPASRSAAGCRSPRSPAAPS